MQKFIKTDYPITDSGESGVARGSSIGVENSDKVFWLSSALLFVSYFMVHNILNYIRFAAEKSSHGAGAREIFYATSGFFVNAGWLVFTAYLTVNQWVMSLSENNDDGNQGQQIISLVTMMSAAVVAFVPMVLPTFKKVYFAPYWASLGTAFALLAGRLHNRGGDFAQMIKNTYSTDRGAITDVQQFTQVHLGFTVALSTIFFLWTVLGMVSGPSTLYGTYLLPGGVFGRVSVSRGRGSAAEIVTRTSDVADM